MVSIKGGFPRPLCSASRPISSAELAAGVRHLQPEMLPGQIIWNNTRNRVMAYYLQQNGFNIIPTASWCTEDDFDWCFDGLPERTSIAVSTNGCLSSPYSRRIFMTGVEELYRQKNPTHLIVCGREIEELNKYTNVVYYPGFSQRWKERGH